MNGCRQNGCCQLIKTYQSTIKHLNDGFVYHKHIIFTLCCRLLWCFYEQFGLSFWRHPFVAEDALVRKWCNAKSLPMEKQTCLHLEWHIFIFEWVGFYSFKAVLSESMWENGQFFKLLKVHSVILQRWVLRWSKDIKGVDETADVSGCPLFLLKVNRRPRLTWKL